MSEVMLTSTKLKGVSFFYMSGDNGAQINVERDGCCIHYLKVEVQADGNMKAYVASDFDNDGPIIEIPLKMT